MGSNIAVAASAVRMTLRWSQAPGSADLDLSALLLQAHGKVGVEEDFVFYNQPQHPSGAVVHLTRSQTGQDFDRIDVELDRVPADVARVVITASVSGANFGQISGLELTMDSALTDQRLAIFPMRGNAETAFICGELYRRAGAWKFRAVGQGYSAGLAGIATDFGITVDDAPPPPPPPVKPQPTPTPVQPTPVQPAPQASSHPATPATPQVSSAGTAARPPTAAAARQRTGDIASQVQEAFAPPPPEEKSRKSAERDFGKEAEAIGKILAASGEVPLVIASDTAFNTRVVVVTDQRAFQIKGGKIRRELPHNQVQVTRLRPLFDGTLVIVESFAANQDFRSDDPRREEHILQVKVATPDIANLIRGSIDSLIGA